ncbi:hypothetical protein PHLGIDRAFT_28016 [Phlebiopsis gigantea 11061_1 CR5-6]|uniref:DUF6533 domain-containing protein n=1 Tax=Phlebiopsis gigantea (strain 11061_1 CR5-6) TaxID=745531 RepID=A0A0C3S5L9_PHLG1|nr:hypothetical protein PHLGIDRAFT_28016 [Phlebiopsis gigantea 11061_1 CR5-6]
MEMSALDIPVSLMSAVENGAAVKAMSLVGLTALVYDHLLTFDLEVDLLWRCRPGFVSLIFLLNRYIVPCMLIVDTYELSGVSEDSVLFCKIWTTLQSYLTVASFMSIHALVAVRVFALHNGRSWVRKFLWLSGTLYFLSTIIIVTLGTIPVFQTLQPYHGACVGTMPWWLWTTWLPSVFFETTLFLLTLVALLNQQGRRSFSQLTSIIYRDGMVYFTAVTTCSSFCLLIWAFAPITLNGLARYFPLAVVNIVASRMVLNLKAFAASKRPASTDIYTSYRPRRFVSHLASAPLGRFPQPRSSLSPESSIDLEMYAIEREYQQLGTRLR